MKQLTVLILGGYGTFGGRLARLLVEDARLSIIVAGRSRATAEAFGKKIGVRGVALDRNGALEPTLKDLAPTSWSMPAGRSRPMATIPIAW